MLYLRDIRGNQHEWRGYVRALVILGNLVAGGRALPMIVVMRNGSALPDGSPPPDRVFTRETAAGFAGFERDLPEFLFPAVQARYSV